MKGSNNITDIRKNHTIDSLIPSFGAKKVGMFHQASAGETGIDLSNLNMPSSYSGKGYSNPSNNEITTYRISYFKNNVKIISSDRGILPINDYTIASNTQINFDSITANANEIFEVWFEPSIIGGATIVDSRPLVKTYTLAAGTTDVPVEPFEINKHPLEQLGAVMVFRGPGMNLQFRNTNNATASLTADGNYEEVYGAGGLSSIIRFNVPAGYGGENIIVVSVGALTERPTQSMISYLENLNGDLEVIRYTLAALSGQPVTNFSGQPHSIDLATFGTRFNQILNTEIELFKAEKWTGFVPTGTWTTNVTYSGIRRRMGENLEVNFLITVSGSIGPAATQLGFDFPSGFPLGGIYPYTQFLKSGHVYQSGNRIPIGMAYLVSNQMYVRLLDPSSASNHYLGTLFSTTGPITLGSGDFLEMQVSYPVSGWQATETKTIKELAGI